MSVYKKNLKADAVLLHTRARADDTKQKKKKKGKSKQTEINTILSIPALFIYSLKSNNRRKKKTGLRKSRIKLTRFPM